MSVDAFGENKTEILNNRVFPDSIPTADRPGKSEPAPTVKVSTSETPESPVKTIAAITPKPPPTETQTEKRGVAGTIFNIALGVVGVIFVLALFGGMIVGVVEWSQDRHVFVANSSPTPTVTPTPKATATPSATPSPTPEPTPTKPIVIPNPTLDPRSIPSPVVPNMEGHYYLRSTDEDTVVLNFDVYDQDGTNFSIRDDDDKLYGTVHLDRTEKNELVGYVVWENSAGEKDREIIYICENWQGLCGKLPFQAWYFVATKR